MATWSRRRSAKGAIRSLDVAAAEASPGVVKVLTSANVPKQGTQAQQVKPQLVGDRVSAYGQAIAFVVAETFEQARAAAALVRADYEVAGGAFDLRAGMSDAKTPPDRNGTPADSKVGRFDDAYAVAPVRLDVTYTTPVQTHAMMEPHATLAVWDGERVTLYTANQMPNRGQDALAKVLGTPQGERSGWSAATSAAASGPSWRRSPTPSWPRSRRATSLVR